MRKSFEHCATVRRSFADVCHILERDPMAVMERATVAASLRSVALVAESAAALPDFDGSQPLAVEVDQIEHVSDQHARLRFRWTANRRKRLLANVETTMDIAPAIGETGRSGCTELTMTSSHDPASTTAKSTERLRFGRRVVSSALDRLLDDMVEHLEEYEESIV